MAVHEHAAVFLDRDGTLIEDVAYPREPDRVRLLPGVAEALRQLQRQGLLLVVVSNQSGIGRGLITQDEAAAVAARLHDCLAEEGVRLHGCYYCPHAPQELCTCRKPAPGMLLQAADDLGIALERSFLVGDKPSDIEAGRRVGCRTIRFGPLAPEDAEIPPDCLARNWSEVVRYLLRNLGVDSAG